MVGFHDVQLPTKYSRGSLFGPGFRTQITELDGTDKAVQRYPPQGRRKFNLSRGIDDIDSLLELKNFFLGRSGSENAFRVKDWSDYATTVSGTTHRPGDVAVSETDQVLQQITARSYQLVKHYVSGPTTVTRAIKKPVTGTTKIAFDGVNQTSGFSVNTNTGIVTLTADPGPVLVEGGCQFDVPCRFDVQTDRNLQIAIEALDTGSLPEIMVIEDFDPATFSQNRNFGGSRNHGNMGGSDVTIDEVDGVLHIVEPTVTSLAVIIPSPLVLPTGGPWFVIRNQGSQSVAIEDVNGTTLVATLAVGQQADIWLGLTAAGLRAWYAGV